MNLGERIKNLRMNLALTRSQLAKDLNIRYSTMSNYENNVRQPDYDTLISIARYFSVDLNILLGFEQFTNKRNNNPVIELFILEAEKLPEKELLFFIKFLKFVNTK